MGDIFPSHQHPYVLGIWALGAVAGPITGPVIGGFAAQAESWRWPILELLWISAFTVIFLALFLPETNGPTILLRRAERLRALTGNPELKTATERADESAGVGKVVYDALVLPLVLSIEPVLLFANIYLGFICEWICPSSGHLLIPPPFQTPSSICGLKLSHWSLARSTTSTRASADSLSSVS